ICSIDSSDQDGIDDSAIVTYQSSSEDLYKLQIAIASKENILSQTALKVLMKRRDDLSVPQQLEWLNTRDSVRGPIEWLNFTSFRCNIFALLTHLLIHAVSSAAEY
ncbi:hypothetical protein Prudu_001664, partial [Prunus dulcis]